MLRFTFPFLFLLASCAAKPSNELEQMGEDVLKSKRDEGIQIEIKPIPKQTGKASLEGTKACRSIAGNHQLPKPEKPNPPGIEIIKVSFVKESNG